MSTTPTTVQINSSATTAAVLANRTAAPQGPRLGVIGGNIFLTPVRADLIHQCSSTHPHPNQFNRVMVEYTMTKVLPPGQTDTTVAHAKNFQIVVDGVKRTLFIPPTALYAVPLRSPAAGTAIPSVTTLAPAVQSGPVTVQPPPPPLPHAHPVPQPSIDPAAVAARAASVLESRKESADKTRVKKPRDPTLPRGVSRVHDNKKPNGRADFYVARVGDRNVTFQIHTYGEEEARRLAIEARNSGVRPIPSPKTPRNYVVKRTATVQEALAAIL